MAKMKILLLFFASCLSFAACWLSPSGLHVCRKSVAYHTYESRRYYRRAYQNYKTKTGLFGWWRRTVYRTYSTAYYEKYLVTRYRNSYICCSGWSRSNYQCSIPICARGCGHGRCTSPNKCTCYRGYHGDKCQYDINECSSSPCDHNCRNLPGTYACTCRAGFTKTNPFNPTDRSCSDVNECSAKPCSCYKPVSSCRASCRNTYGSFVCSCSSGFQLNSVRGAVCVDINECSSSTLNTCGRHCYNTPGSFSCNCAAGYRLSPDSKTCIDIDECKSFNGACDHICTNQIGSFQCLCRQGYQLLYDKRRCGDINECVTEAPCHLSKSMCHNYPGSYQCVCKPGYQMLPNNRTCSDINECNTTVGICQHQCTNFEGSYSCSCNAGYRLDQDKHKCYDVDECKKGSHRCDHTCQNSIGAYICLCRRGYILNADGFTCRALPCMRISKPVFGAMNCTGFVTDSVCNFSCSLGFDLQGSNRRSCLSSTTWSGYKARCQRKKCPALAAPIHGSIVIPCFQLFGSTCMKRCENKYYLNGNRTSQCALNGDNILAWTNEDTKCKAIAPCHPNPCHHNGDCIQLSTAEYSCNCDGTGYTGQNCEIAMVVISELPPVLVGIDSEYVAVTTQAEENIEISIQEETGMLTFSPNSVTLKYPERKASFKIASNKPGTYKVKYKINKNKLPILPLQDDLVYVFQNDVPKPVQVKNDIFNQGCQLQKLTDNVSLTSFCKWNNRGTSGLVSISAPVTKNIPLSMNGIMKESFANFMHNGVLTLGDEIRQLLEHNSFATCSTQCNATFDKKLVDVFISNFYFPQLLFKALDYHFPSWFSVNLGNKEHKYNPENLHSTIVSATNLEKYPLCAQLHNTRTKSHQYVVYTPKMFMNFQFHSSIQKVSDLTATCFAVNLMNGIASVNIGKGLDISRDFATLGMPVNYFTLSSLLFIPLRNKMEHCAFTGEQKICIHPTMKIKASIISTFNVGKFRLDGYISLETNNLDMLLQQKLDVPFKSIFSGSLIYEIKMNFLGKSLLLQGNEQNSGGFMRHSDSLGYWEIILNPILTASSFVYDYSTVTFHPLKHSFVKMLIKGNGGRVTGVKNTEKTYLKLRTYQRYFLTYTTNLEKSLKVKYNELYQVFAPLQSSAQLSLNVLVQEFAGHNISYEKVINLFKKLSEDLVSIESFVSTLKYWLKSKQIKEFDKNISLILNYVSSFKTIEINPTLSSVTFDQKYVTFSYVGEICLYNLCLNDMSTKMKYGLDEDKITMISNHNTTRNLAARLRVKKGDVLYLNIHKNKHWFKGYMNVSIKVFDRYYDTILIIDESSLSYNLTVKLNKKYHFEVFAHSNLQELLSWKNIISEVKGKSMTMSQHLNTVMQRNFEEIAKDTNARLHLSLQRFSDVRKKVDFLNELQVTRKKQYDNVSRKYRRAYGLYQHAILQLNTSQQLMDSYTFIKGLYIEKNLTGLCLIQACEKKCLYVPVCEVCQDRVIRTANYLKCDQREEEVRSVIEKSCPSTCEVVKHIFTPQYTGSCKQDLGEQAMIDAFAKNSISFVATTAGKLIGSIFGPGGSIIGNFIGKAVGYIVGMFFSCSRTYEMAIHKIAYNKPCFLPCTHIEVLKRKVSNCYNEKAHIQGRSNVTRQCNCIQSCVSKVANISCTLNNINCIKKRQLFLNSSRTIPRNFTDLHETIEKQKISIERLRTKARNFLHSKKFFKHELMKTKIMISNAEKEQNMVEERNLLASSILSSEICIMTTFSHHPNVSNIVYVATPVTFNGTLPFFQNVLLRLEVRNELSGETKNFAILYSFDDDEMSLKTAMRNVLVATCKSKRERRSLNDDQLHVDDASVSPMQKGCLELKRTTDLIKYAFSSLQNLTNDALQLKSMINASEESLEINKNAETSHSVLNAQSEVTSFLKYEVSVYRNRTTVTYVLTQWKQNMEFYRNEQNISSCLAFVDCLISSLSDLKNLPSNFINKDNFYSMLSNITKSVVELTEQNSTAHTLEVISLETTDLLDDVDTMLKNCLHCMPLPKLVSPDTNYYDVENGSHITINCGTVQSKLPVSYTWKHNGKFMDEETKSSLKMSVELSDRGNYICEVTSKVGTVTSNATYINVYKKPAFVENLNDVTLFLPNVQNISSHLFCNITAFPKPSYKWFYQKFDLLKSPIQLTATSLVYSTSDLDFSHSGYYYCKSSNKYGEITSRVARLDILEIQYPTFVLTIGVNVSNVVFGNKSVHMTEVNASFFGPIVQKMNLFDTQNITTDFNESRLTITISSLTKLIYSNETMEDILNSNVKARQDLSVAAAVLIRQISNASMTLINNNDSYFGIVEDSLSVSAKFNICRHGYELHKNGMICVQCPAGTFGNEQGFCVACDKGYYQDLPGHTYCKKCYLEQGDKNIDYSSKHYCERVEEKAVAAEQTYTWIIVGIIVFCVVILVLVIILCVCKKKRHQKMAEDKTLLPKRNNPTFQPNDDEEFPVVSYVDCVKGGQTTQALIVSQEI
ncbi:uncharacterized protein LOC130641844 [Hydractinia symbiolongicarpus]|uniref:uncharacterized protein LOC130641844 n=1 Tax=Hydractinia symbiolongicarpus TaxID=13093 RepID=UPI00254A8DDE|nr:uncharacterized protein LOC130641844 [Hydractinia symbiolongicarpus]